MSKEKILEEFDKKLLKVCDVYEKAADNTSEKLENWEKERKEIKQFISQAIDQTREETIREVDEGLPLEYHSDGGYEKGFNSCLSVIKQSLKLLINK